MANVIFRLEKTVEGKTYYREFQREARNSILRLWNTFNGAGLNVAHREHENFHNSADADTYLKNMRAQFEKDGFVDIAAPAKKTKKTEKVEKTAEVPAESFQQ